VKVFDDGEPLAVVLSEPRKRMLSTEWNLPNAKTASSLIAI